jgi:hypothetical protein
LGEATVSRLGEKMRRQMTPPKGAKHKQRNRRKFQGRRGNTRMHEDEKRRNIRDVRRGTQDAPNREHKGLPPYLGAATDGNVKGCSEALK